MSMTASCDFFRTYCLSASSKEKSQETHIHMPTRFTCEELSALLGQRVHGSREPRTSKPSCLSSSNQTCFAHIWDFQLSKTLSCPHLLLGMSSAASLFLLTTKRSPEEHASARAAPSYLTEFTGAESPAPLSHMCSLPTHRDLWQM